MTSSLALSGGSALARHTKTRRAAMKDLKLALLQIHSKQGDIAKNLENLVSRIGDAAKEDANLMVSCELALSAFLMSREEYLRVAQTVPGPATEEIGAAARKANAWVLFGLPEKAGDKLFNSLAVIGPDGAVKKCYRKVHLWLTEHQTFDIGNELCLFETEFGTVGSTICYDIMFPEYVRAIAAAGAGIVTHSTGMVTTTDCDRFAWDPGFYNALIRTRAWENQVYIPSCNRCGNDQFLYFLANSCIAAPWGEIVGKLGQAEGTLVAATDFARLEEWKGIAPYWNDRRPEFYRDIMDF